MSGDYESHDKNQPNINYTKMSEEQEDSMTDAKKQMTSEHSENIEQTKEERDAKSDKVYLGNVKVVWTNDNNVGVAPKQEFAAAAPAGKPGGSNEPDDLPF